ncbi:hypothetical protein C8F01DRAFT_516789 [Mycena amicta]|nr:hypothetical protein C8F01DRAFT_516789 [Mycena amicta]
MHVHKIKPVSIHTVAAVRNQRNPGRRDGFRWNSPAFLCPTEVDGFTQHSRDPGDAMLPIVPETNHVVPPKLLDEDCVDRTGQLEGRREVSIWEMARYAPEAALKHKPKGVAKGFEMIRAPTRVIALDEDVFSVIASDSSDWEDALGSEWDELDGSEFELVEEEHDDDFLLARRLQEEEDARFAAEHMRVYRAREGSTSNG